MTAATDRRARVGPAIAVLAEPRYSGALELGVSPAAETDAEELVVLAPRPRLLHGPLRLAGQDPDELTDGAAAAAREEIRRRVGELAPGLPHLIIEPRGRSLRDLIGLAERRRCAALVIPRRARRRARFGRPGATRRTGLALVVAP